MLNRWTYDDECKVFCYWLNNNRRVPSPNSSSLNNLINTLSQKHSPSSVIMKMRNFGYLISHKGLPHTNQIDKTLYSNFIKCNMNINVFCRNHCIC